ncbi:MAG: glycosyl hydrolase [Gammaproteobacteria bacterium]|nr:MAG: glycosyl hydrolase [Gammaproteobacteria bacterium]
MNIADKERTGDQGTDTGIKDTKVGQKIVRSLLSLVPWVIVGGLLWAGIFVKPNVTIEEVTPPAIERRDRIYGVSAVTPRILWIVGNYGKILRSEDRGASWSLQKTPNQNHLQDISSWDESRAIAVGNGGVVLITEDGGNTWTEIEAPKSEIANKLLRVHTFEGGEAWAVGEVGMIIYSDDYGNTWTRMREEEDVIMNDIVKISDTKLMVAGEYGRIFWSEDKGKTWQDTETDSLGSMMAIKFRTEESGVMVGLDGITMGTEDAGKTWTIIDSAKSGNSEHLMDVLWFDELNKWVAIGNKGTLVKFSSDLKEFEAGVVSERSLSSHTELAAVDGGIIVVGAGVSFLEFTDGDLSVLGK